MFWPCETRTSTCRSFATISSGLYRFLAITVLLDVKDIPQVGPLQWGRITLALPLRPIAALGQDEEPGSTGRHTGGRGGEQKEITVGSVYGGATMDDPQVTCPDF